MGLIFILKMPKKVVKKGKVVAAGGAGGSGGSSLFAKSPRNFRIGGDIQPKRNLTRFVKWPKYVRIQRKKAIMMQRLKAPPVLAQFKNTIDKNQASQLLKLLAKYSPETKKEKKDRLQSEAEAKKANAGPKPIHLKFGSTTSPPSAKKVRPSSSSWPTMSTQLKSWSSSQLSAEPRESHTASSRVRPSSVSFATPRPPLASLSPRSRRKT